ncbi:MAG: hypothetical protein IPN95_22140 [Bacteroidetes bacterium]|nr:hypothetical protein [Bacteroidota bacterium]
MGTRYRSLDVKKVIETIRHLELRIEDRFPGSGLGKVCKELEDLAEVTRQRIEWIKTPKLWIRIGIGSIIVLMVAILLYTISTFKVASGNFTVGDLVQISEAGLNDVVLIGAAVFFLFSVENRVKRSRALKVLYELRAIAHVIDMHQLVKDPSRQISQNTEHSPKVDLTPAQLTRYLDYCSEMLSLTSKVGALYAQAIDDSVVLQTVNEVEELTTSLSQKIWQKIMVIKELEMDQQPNDPLRPASANS